MIRRVVLVPRRAAQPVRDAFLHRLSVTDNVLKVKTWLRQADGVVRPGDGNLGGNVHGLDLAPRLDGGLFWPRGEILVPWNAGAMVPGSVHYICVRYDGSPAAAPFDCIELDDLAALSTPEARALAQYPHWHHKLMVYSWRLVDGVGADIVIAGRVTVEDAPPQGFDACKIDCFTTNLGAVGAWDHHDPATGTVLRDTRPVLEDGSPNPDVAPHMAHPPMPQGWIFG